jgi:single-stranded DNA-binding protein
MKIETKKGPEAGIFPIREGNCMEEKPIEEKITAKDMNIVSLRGMIVRKYSTPKLTMFTLSIRDYAARRQENGTYMTNYPVVFFFDKQGETLNECFRERDMVTVKAIVQNTFNHVSLTGEQQIWGLTMEKTKTIFGELTNGEVDGNNYLDDVNNFVLCGRLRNIRMTSKNWLRLTIRTVIDNGKYKSSNNVSLRVRDAQETMKELTIGSRLIVNGKIQTSDGEDERGRRRRFERIIANNMQIINRAQPQAEEAQESPQAEPVEIPKPEVSQTNEASE